MRPLNHPRKAVVLLSGGIDSATTLAIAHAEGMELYALSFDYGQRHLRELESAKMVARSFAVKKHHIANFTLRDIGGSALTSEIAVPKDGPTTKGKGQTTGGKNASPPDSATSRIPVTYVPARNTIFLSFALAWAEVINAEHIYIGANAVDYSGYPDCRPEYLQSFERMANLATKESVEGRLTFSIRAPLLLMTKADIIKTGLRLGLDYALTWSCYDPQPKEALGSSLSHHPEEKKRRTRKAISRELWGNYAPCGSCDSCRFRERGFREAGVRDPLVL